MRKHRMVVVGVDKSGEPILDHDCEGDEDDNASSELEQFQEAENDHIASESD